MEKKKYERHGLNRTTVLLTWQNMMRRCYDRKSKAYPLYGARGIKVCDRWKNSVLAFYEDMGPPPTPQHTIDRINTFGDYLPQNCRWATRVVQARNTRRNHVLVFQGITGSVAEWAERLGLKVNTLHSRLRLGMPIAEVLDKRLKHQAKGGRGVRNVNCRLTEAQVLQIFKSSKTLAALAAEFGVSKGTIRHIKLGWTWKHVTEELLKGGQL